MTQPLFLKNLPKQPQSIRYDWIEQVSQLPGKTLHLGVALLYYAQLIGGSRLRLTRRMMRRFNVSREACYEGLRRLDAAGLIKVWRLPGRSPMITLVEPQTDIVLKLVSCKND